MNGIRLVVNRKTCLAVGAIEIIVTILLDTGVEVEVPGGILTMEVLNIAGMVVMEEVMMDMAIETKRGEK